MIILYEYVLEKSSSFRYTCNKHELLQNRAKQNIGKGVDGQRWLLLKLGMRMLIAIATFLFVFKQKITKDDCWDGSASKSPHCTSLTSQVQYLGPT